MAFEVSSPGYGVMLFLLVQFIIQSFVRFISISSYSHSSVYPGAQTVPPSVDETNSDQLYLVAQARIFNT
jgi:hypothetical protein